MARKARWAYIVNVFEASVGRDYPVVSHVFYGKTQSEATDYYEAHLETDEFLRDCVARGQWDEVECWSESHWERLS